MLSKYAGQATLLLLVGAGAIKFATTAPEIAETYVSQTSVDVSMNALTTETGDVKEEMVEGVVELGQCEETPEMVLDIISRERALLSDEKRIASEDLAEVKLAREKLDVERNNLQELKDEVEGLIRKVEATHTDDVDRLIKLYSAMKPVEAASIMSDMDVEVAVMVLGAMAENKAAPILAKMTTIRAQAISKIIYERSKLPGDQKLNGIRLN